VLADRTDKIGMSSPATYQRTVWLLTKGELSVTMTVSEDDSGVALVVRGFGTEEATYRFARIDALMAFAAAQEQKLLDDGFQLQAFSERRSGIDRRRRPRPGAPERRRSR
jgi:hypothetical protein